MFGLEFLEFGWIRGMILGLDEVLGIFEKSRALFSLFRRQLVSCGFHRCRVKEASDSHFDGSIESGMSSIIDLHMWFVFTGSKRIPRVLSMIKELVVFCWFLPPSLLKRLVAEARASLLRRRRFLFCIGCIFSGVCLLA